MVTPLQDARILFDQYLRAEEQRLAREGLHPVQPDSAALFNLHDVQVGDQRSFFVLNPSNDQFVEQTATAQALGAHSVIFVDNDINLTPQLQQDLQLMHTDFDTIIYPRSVRFFGAESDVNGDGRVTILITSVLSSGGVVGFFFPGDLFPLTVQPNSNEQEILYVAPPSASRPLGLIEGTMAHEFQHLINFNQKIFVGGGEDTEDLWLNEALSHFAEDVIGFSENGDDLVNVVRAYLNAVDLVSLTGNNAFGGNPDTIERRGAGYLFLRYLFEQTGGATYSQTDPADLTDNGGITFLRQLESSPALGIENIRTALQAVDNPFGQASDPFREAFANWVIALAIDGTGLNSNLLFNYQPPEFDQITGQLRGIDLRGTREGQSGPVTLQGPSTPFFNDQPDTLQGTGVVYVLFQAAPTGGNTTTIRLSGNAASQLQLTVIRTK
jgi:hypothetical protein